MFVYICLGVVGGGRGPIGGLRHWVGEGVLEELCLLAFPVFVASQSLYQEEMMMAGRLF